MAQSDRTAALRLFAPAVVSAAVSIALMACGPTPRSASDGLVYIALHAGSNEVMRIRLADGETRRLTTTPDAEERWPYWTDTGQRLVFQRETRGNSDLVLWDPSSEVESVLRESPVRDERWPVWTPDGQALVYAFRGGKPKAGIAQERLSDHHTQLLAVSGALDFFFRPTIASDGRRMVAQRRGADGHGSRLWSLTPGALPKPLTADRDAYDMKPAFARDGETVVFSRRTEQGGPRSLWRISAAGGAGEAITSGDSDDHSGRPSPVRDQIAFVSDRSGNSDIYLIDSNGTNLRALTQTTVHEFAPHWSPDGEKLVVTTFPPGTSDPAKLEGARIVVLDRAGRTLLDVEGAMPDWMPPWP